ncbi:MMPL family transporter [Janibacter hoylei]|uniref:MMPL family transporter n=1 Tax=Janibacter hoylei TaxID=364298 RepID=UPI00389AD702
MAVRSSPSPCSSRACAVWPWPRWSSTRWPRPGGSSCSGQSQGILFILVVGAATDYGLLLVARYREELHRADPLPALRVAWRQTLGPVMASGLTVIAGLLCLLLSDLGNISGLGPVGALGIVGAMVAALTLLPAVLALLGRVAFWPSPPRRDDAPRHRLWQGVADRVTRRPRRTWVVTAAAMFVAAGAATTLTPRASRRRSSSRPRSSRCVGRRSSTGTSTAVTSGRSR